MTIQEINRAIISGQFSDQELTSIVDAVRYNRASMGKRIKNALHLGDTVEWHSVKRGINGRGTVTKIAIKYVTVREGSTLWKVPANMLTRVELAVA